MKKNKVFLVTGASSGIGQALVEKLSKDKQGLILAVARRENKLLKLASENEDVVPLVCDLGDSLQRRELMANIRKQFGGVDVLVNNAGLGYKSSFFEPDETQWATMLEVNVLALSLLAAFSLSAENSRKVNHIVNVCSMAGHRLPGVGGMYSASKYAVRAISESIRREVSAKKLAIRVTQVSPAITETEFLDNYLGNKEKKLELYGHLKPLQSGDIADAILYALAAPANVDINDILIRPLHQET